MKKSVLFLSLLILSAGVYGASGIIIQDNLDMELTGNLLMNGNKILDSVLISPRIDKGVDSAGTGFKHQREVFTVSGTTTVNMSWDGSFPDKNYTATCSYMTINGGSLGDITFEGIQNKYESSIQAVFSESQVGDAEVELNCMGVRDG